MCLHLLVEYSLQIMFERRLTRQIAIGDTVIGGDGPISVHTEYEFDETIIRRVGYADHSPPNLEKWAQQAAIFLKSAIDRAIAKVS